MLETGYPEASRHELPKGRALTVESQGCGSLVCANVVLTTNRDRRKLSSFGRRSLTQCAGPDAGALGLSSVTFQWADHYWPLCTAAAALAVVFWE
jgi:hypothetical protein